MNLGLTGPLNPLRPGNAALGAEPPRPQPAVRREAAGSGVFCCIGSASEQGWAPRVQRAGAPLRHPLPLGVPPSLRGPGARLCTFLTRPAGLARERQLGWRDPRRGARGPEPPRRFPGPGASLDPGPGRGLRRSVWRPRRGAGCAVLR